MANLESQGDAVVRVVSQLQRIDPSYADRFIRQIEVAEAHRQNMERRDATLEWAGLISGLIVALAFLASSTWLIATGRTVSGTIIATVDLVALVTLFLSRWSDHRTG